jgi:transcriptional regulator with XRE-family HTH domain
MQSDMTEGNAVLGERVRELRLDKSMTLKALAAASGLSAGMLSQIENNLVDPSLATLRKLATVFDSSIAALFTEPNTAAVHISTPSTRRMIGSRTGEVQYERLTPGRGDLEVLKTDIPPGHSSSSEAWGHPSSECVYVVRGIFTIEVDGETYELAEQQSITFDSRLQHRYMNLSDSVTTILIAVTPPAP